MQDRPLLDEFQTPLLLNVISNLFQTKAFVHTEGAERIPALRAETETVATKNWTALAGRRARVRVLLKLTIQQTWLKSVLNHVVLC